MGGGTNVNGGGGSGSMGSGYSSSDDDEFRVGVVDCVQGIMYEYVVRVGGSDSSAGGSADVWTASLRRELIIRMGDADSRQSR